MRTASVKRNLVTLLAYTFFIVVAEWSVTATRLRIGPSEEDPPTSQVYNDLRHLRAHPNYYYLDQAGVPVSEEETSKAFLRGNTQQNYKDFVTKHFKFNSSEQIRRFQTHSWFFFLDERIALHVYDDPKDLESSTGPQVNQELCGVHLEYLLHMMRKHHKHITETTDLSLFRIMNAFDLPHLGLAEGNSVFPGSYQTCETTELSLIKRELVEMFDNNKQEADKYFTLTVSLGNEEHKVLNVANLLSRISKFANRNLRYLKPFFGYFVEDSITHKSIDIKTKSKLKTIGTRYCFAGIRWPSWSNSSWARRHMTMRVAMCIPETCDSSSLRMNRDKFMQLLDKQMTSYHSGYYIENLFCLPDENSDFRNPFYYTGTQILFVFLCFWALLTILASVGYPGERNEHDQSLWWWNHVKCWCIQKNVKDFFAEPVKINAPKIINSSGSHRTDEPFDAVKEQSADNKKMIERLNFEPLEGFKVLGSLSVMTSHIVMLWATAHWMHMKSESLWHSWLSIIASLCPSVVDMFFVITGTITVRTLSLMVSENKQLGVGFWLKYILYRYLRIVPLYLLFQMFLQHAFRFMGSGPFWDYGTSHSAWSRICQDESVWRILLPSANFISPSVHCNGVGWYVANDLQFTLLVPLIVPILLKRPKLGHSLIGSACLIGTLAHVKYFWDYDPDPRGLLEWNSLVLNRIFDDTTAGYVNPQYRFVAYFIGLSFGHLLDSYERQEISQWPSYLVTFGKWFFYVHVYLLCVLPFISSLMLDWDETILRWIAALVSGTNHLTFSLAFALFMLNITTGKYSPIITNCLGSRLFKLLAKMSHSTMLVHLPLFFYHQQTMRALTNITKYDMFKSAIVWELEAFVLSFIVHILFEIPLRRSLIKLLLNLLTVPGGRKKQISSKKKVTIKEKIKSC